MLWTLGMIIALIAAYVRLTVSVLTQTIAAEKELNAQAHAGFNEKLKSLGDWRHDLEDARSGYLAAEFMKGKR